jgi:hypothetical protein
MLYWSVVMMKKEKNDVTKKLVVKNGSFVIARTLSAGVFAGILKSRNGKEVVLNDARRLWYWNGASSLSQLAVDGVKYPNECKFPVAVPEVLLTEVIEILVCTSIARQVINSVPIWGI